jgi:hypothetical protein
MLTFLSFLVTGNKFFEEIGWAVLYLAFFIGRLVRSQRLGKASEVSKACTCSTVKIVSLGIVSSLRILSASIVQTWVLQ